MRFLLFIITLISILFYGCEKFDESENKNKISRYDSSESHEDGTNCMSCHYTEGKGEGWFTLNGNFQKSTVELTKQKDSVSLIKVEVDRLGNFYTTKAIDFTNGLYTGVRSSSGIIVYKEEKIFSGQCNLCHGTNVKNLNIIW